MLLDKKPIHKKCTRKHFYLCKASGVVCAADRNTTHYEALFTHI
jgi:hypothetical protein